VVVPRDPPRLNSQSLLTLNLTAAKSAASKIDYRQMFQVLFKPPRPSGTAGAQARTVSTGDKLGQVCDPLLLFSRIAMAHPPEDRPQTGISLLPCAGNSAK